MRLAADACVASRRELLAGSIDLVKYLDVEILYV
jgi:hypothetical protein